MNEGTTTNYMYSPIKSFKELKSHNNNEKKLSFRRITNESFFVFVFVVRAVNKGR